MTASLLSRLKDYNPLSDNDDFSCVVPSLEELIEELKMLLTSRVRLSDIESIPALNDSVLNYGVNECFNNIIEIDSRRMMMETHLKNTVARFEPRLTQVLLTSSIDTPQTFIFILQGRYFETPVIVELIWNFYSGVFYFNE